MWKPVKGFEERYEVSSDGEIASLPRDYKYGVIANRTILKADIARGYKRVTLFKNGRRYRKLVHIIVAETFLDNPENKPMVNHKDENKLNNAVENLMWCTAKENSNWGTCSERISKKVSKAVFQFDKDGRFVKEWSSMTAAANKLEIPLSCISICAHHKTKTAGNYIWRFADERN